MTSLLKCDKCGITGDRMNEAIKFHQIRVGDLFLNEPSNHMYFLIGIGRIGSRSYSADLCDKCFQEMDKTFYLSNKSNQGLAAEE